MEVIPGKSTKVRLGQLGENTLRTIGLLTIIFALPQTLSVT
jgi:hypothetical protein